LLWPKSYVATTSILAQSSDIITPLLEGRAVPTGVSDRAGMARQVIFGRKVLTDILVTGGWMESHPTPIEQDRLMEQIKDRTQVNSPRPELVQITYAIRIALFRVTQRFAIAHRKSGGQGREAAMRSSSSTTRSPITTETDLR
jgi:hypothetical protein